MADKIDTFIEGVVKLAKACDISQIEFIETLAQLHASAVITYIDIINIDKPRKVICEYIDAFGDCMQNIYTKEKGDAKDGARQTPDNTPDADATGTGAQHGDEWQMQKVFGDWQKPWTPYGDETGKGKGK